MAQNLNISLNVSHFKDNDWYFSLKLKSQLITEQALYIKPSRIFTISGIEGDFSLLCRLLIRNGILGKHLNWTFGEGHLVIIGDIFGKGSQGIECFWLIYSLEDKAQKEGGHVHYILGSKDINNINGSWKHDHPNYALQTSSTKRTSSAALFFGNLELWNWLHTKNIVEQIGDILFLHSSHSNEIKNFTNLNSLNRINNSIRPSSPKLTRFQITKPLEYIVTGNNIPSTEQSQIPQALNNLNITTIILGCSSQDVIKHSNSTTVINVNSSMDSSDFKAIYIKRSRYYYITDNGEKKEIK